jgi:hypothetical protein
MIAPGSSLMNRGGLVGTEMGFNEIAVHARAQEELDRRGEVMRQRDHRNNFFGTSRRFGRFRILGNASVSFSKHNVPVG